MNDTYELMQTITWNTTERLPEPQNVLELSLGLADLLIAHDGDSVTGYFNTEAKAFFDNQATTIQHIDAWAYRPKYPKE